MGYSAAGYCFSSLGEAVAVAATGVGLSSTAVRVVGYEASSSKAIAVTFSNGQSVALQRYSVPMCTEVNKALPVAVNATFPNVTNPASLYGTDSGVVAMTFQQGSSFQQIPADIVSAAAFWGFGFSSILGLYWFSYFVGQVIGLTRFLR